MNDNRWSELIDKLESSFTILDRGREELENVPHGVIDFLIFEGPAGKMMVERTTKPKTLGEKSFGGSKYGAGSNVEKIYSDSETVSTIQVYKEIGGEWEPIEVEL